MVKPEVDCNAIDKLIERIVDTYKIEMDHLNHLRTEQEKEQSIKELRLKLSLLGVKNIDELLKSKRIC